MKAIKGFLNTALRANELPFFCGGKEIPTSMMGENCSDIWYDNDNDGKFSPGDSICFDECVENNQ